MWSLCARRGRRRTKREDRYTAHPFITTDSAAHPVSLFAVFDGHGGDRAAQLASVRISELVLHAVRRGAKLPRALEDAFQTMDRELAHPLPSTATPATPCVSAGVKSSSSSSPCCMDDLDASCHAVSPLAEGLQRLSSGSAFAAVALQAGDVNSMGYAALTPPSPLHDDARFSPSRCAPHAHVASPSSLTSPSSMAARAARPQGSRWRAASKSRADDQLSTVAVRTTQGCGTTATVAALVGDDVYVAHVGDTRAVLSRAGGVVQRLCEDHRPGRKDEMERIEAAGGIVVKVRGTYRVNGVLAVSRAIGDASLKDLVIATPDVTWFRLGGDEEFMIIATDGLWDVMTDEESVGMVRDVFTGKGGASDEAEGAERRAVKTLIECAWERGSNDDVCVLVVNLMKYKQECAGFHDVRCPGIARFDERQDNVEDVPLELVTPLDDGGCMTQRRRGEKPW